MGGTLHTDLDIREQLARIDRAQAETRKFVEEGLKLAAETRKLTWDAKLLPWFQVATMSGAVATAAVALWKAFHG